VDCRTTTEVKVSIVGSKVPKDHDAIPESLEHPNEVSGYT